ncbi:flavin reductase family protein [Ramlibacter sp.]|uniref:flavin reductase family protein n=1 Tax=Ramlibacter sp. TaxID=1917967 RepID=UPI003D0E9C80
MQHANSPTFKTILSSEIDQPMQYKLLAGVIIPRPIALVTTLGPRGPNAGPYSFFNGIATDPPMVVLSGGPRKTPEGEWAMKDTIRNIEASREFVVNLVSTPILDKMNICATDFDETVDEIDLAGFTTVASKHIAAPRLREAMVHLECRAVQIIPISNRPYRMILGEVLCFHIDEKILQERNRIDVAGFDPVGRLSGDDYTRVTDRLSVRRIPPPKDKAAPGAGGGG